MSVYNPEGEQEEYQIIDGQQRLTTVSLLMLAMYHLIRQGKIVPEDPIPDQLFQAIRSLEIIHIKLDPEDNPQLIFESLNSTGLDLSEGDKIRNYILMGLPAKKQEEYYEKYWNKIEQSTNYQVDLFVRDYLSVKQQATPALNKIYRTFKTYVEERDMEMESLLADLLFYARLYRILLTGEFPDKRLRFCIYRLNRLETTVTRPFFLEALRLYQKGTLGTEDLVSVFLVTETYLLRRTICELPTNQLNKIFLLLHKEILRCDGTEEQYLEKLKYTLLSKKDRARFPDDEEFAEAFGTKQIYQMNAKNKRYIMERFENFGTLEDKDVYRHCDDGEYTIEHIMRRPAQRRRNRPWNLCGAQYQHLDQAFHFEAPVCPVSPGSLGSGFLSSR